MMVAARLSAAATFRRSALARRRLLEPALDLAGGELAVRPEIAGHAELLAALKGRPEAVGKMTTPASIGITAFTPGTARALATSYRRGRITT